MITLEELEERVILLEKKTKDLKIPLPKIVEDEGEELEERKPVKKR